MQRRQSLTKLLPRPDIYVTFTAICG